MVVEAVQNYVAMVNGLSKMTRARAMSTARSLLAHAGLDDVAADAQERVTKLADEILQASKANRDLVENMVRTEIDRAASRWGFPRAEDLEDLRREIAELRLTMAYDSAGPPAAATKAPAKKAAAAKRAAVHNVGVGTKPAPAKNAQPVKKAPGKKAPGVREAPAADPGVAADPAFDA